jgi:Ca2+-binding EF-hand superfamily protein
MKLKMALKSIKQFQNLGTLQLASLNYFSENTLSTHECDELKDTFFLLNVSRTGLLTRQELMDSFWTNGWPDLTYYELDVILAKVDKDNSGKVCFGEFLIPAISPLELISDT